MHRIVVHGVVQGVGFRPSVKRVADELGAMGFVRNDGSHVTILCSVDPDIFMDRVRKVIGPMARIEGWSSVDERDGNEDLAEFRIVPSVEGDRDSSLPPDTAICDSCLEEMTTPGNRRYLYPFTNCTDCGARYTLIDNLPYDRERTSMTDFPMCRNCKDEYSDQSFRRFHAQTLSCPEKGPRYNFLDRRGKVQEDGYDAFIKCAREISSGKIIIVKGWGGMHIICDPARIGDLRKWYDRPFKPFALMARDLEAAKSIAEVPDYAMGPLTSPARPIVLLRKRKDIPNELRDILGSFSPGLGTVGVYLPYSGIHHLLFKALKKIGSPLTSVVMTSANPPGEPMAITLENALKMGADGYLVHDRRISARCDDSVLVPNPFGPQEVRSIMGPFSIRAFPIRKARGLVPDPLKLPHKRTVLSLGAERNVTVTITVNGRGFTSPYVGNSRHPEVLDYASSSAERFMDLFGGRAIEAVGSDLHPRYGTLALARELSEKVNVPLLRYQHHEAHAASLLVDSELETIPVLVLDGVGYGRDGLPWGGEVINASWEKMDRIGSLEQFGLPGGDRSVFHPERIAHWLTMETGNELEINDPETSSLLRATHNGAIKTTSFGRLLDALSSLLLGVTWRTYDGEPAMRLETLLERSQGPETTIFSQPTTGDKVDVIRRWKVLLDELSFVGAPSIGSRMDDQRTADLAMGFVGSILDDMISIALLKGPGEADEMGRRYIGISGGVAYDLPIVRFFIRSCRDKGAFPVVHSRVPPGDGGISIGQAALAGLELEKRL